MTTPNEKNPLWLLFTLYFVPCNFMHQNQLRLKAIFFSSTEQLKQELFPEFMTYTLYWLASLYVVAEGWKELKLSHPAIDRLINDHWDSLRLFRNGVFHFQPADRKHRQFIELDKFNWAEKLHSELTTFFEEQPE